MILNRKKSVALFSAWGRDISDQEGNKIKVAGNSANQALVNAIDNLFRVDAFRKALEPKK